MSLKICHISDYLPEYHRKWGGAERACLNTVYFLARSGKTENFILSLTPKFLPKENYFKFLTVPISEEILGHKLSFLKRLFHFDVFSYFTLKKIFRKIKPDIVHIHNADIISFAAVSAASKMKIPVVFTIYDYLIFSPDRILIRERNFFEKIIFSYFIKKINFFIVLSNNSKEILSEKGISASKIGVVPLVIPFSAENISKNEIKKEYHSILFAGWLEPHKGAFTAVKAMLKIIQKFPEAKLYISGLKEDKKYKNEIDFFIKENNLVENIIWNKEGIAKHKEMFNKAKVIIVPEQWQNMSPVIIAEAMQKGKVVAASRIGGISEIIEHGFSGVLADPKNPDDFALKIIEIFSNSSYAENIEKNAKLRFQEFFNPEVNTAKLIKVYEDSISYCHSRPLRRSFSEASESGNL